MPSKKDPEDKKIPFPKMVVDFNVLRQIAARNFRDLGGHPIAGGRRVRSGMIYRSSHLAQVPHESPLKALALRTLVTLQSRVEVTYLGPPEAAMLKSVRWEHIPMGDEWFTSEGFERMKAEPGQEHLALVMHFRQDWRTFFRLLAERTVYPLLFHCSAGRDRTGVGAAMLLETLGVDRDRIVADFLESNLVFPNAPLSAAQLDPVFALIDEYSGIDGFMREVIGLGSDDLAAVREDLLEKTTPHPSSD
ncbi:MAG TPA: tyrosine-protein phosphatase [Candidatus Binataceae bacterium]